MGITIQGVDWMKNQEYHLFNELTVDILEGVRVPLNRLVVLQEVCD